MGLNKRRIADRGYAVAKINVSQAGATVERAEIDRGYAVGDGDTR